MTTLQGMQLMHQASWTPCRPVLPRPDLLSYAHQCTSLPTLGALPRLSSISRRIRAERSPSSRSTFSPQSPVLQFDGRLYLARLQSRLQATVSGSLEAGDGGSSTGGWQGGGGGRGDGGWGNSGDDSHSRDEGGGSGGAAAGGLFGAFWRGWKRRVRADPQFGFKVFSEVVIGVGACVVGDMASRPNFGLDELDFVFSTIVVGSILNFTLMYMLAPTAAVGQVAQRLPLLFAACPPGHMFEVGKYSLLDRAGTFVYKGVQFAAVGFAAGLVGTALSNLLLSMRKKVDPKFEVQNKPPPTILNALTWAAHMGLSSNARYQTLNGLEFSLAGVLHPTAFKAAVFVLRGLNNVCGGVTFVMLARKTGSQSAGKTVDAAPPADAPISIVPEQSS